MRVIRTGVLTITGLTVTEGGVIADIDVRGLHLDFRPDEKDIYLADPDRVHAMLRPDLIRVHAIRN